MKYYESKGENVTTDTTLDYTGDLQVNFCSDDKELYSIFFADDDSEEL